MPKKKPVVLPSNVIPGSYLANLIADGHPVDDRPKSTYDVEFDVTVLAQDKEAARNAAIQALIDGRGTTYAKRAPKRRRNWDGPDNEERAQWARRSLLTFCGQTGQNIDDKEALEEVVGDFLANLMHLCVRHGVDFNKRLKNGRSHFRAEQRGDD